MADGHLFHAVGNCCILCGVPLVLVEHRSVFTMEPGDNRDRQCPGGPATNLRAISHRIAERKLARRMQYNRPFRYPPA